MASTRGLRSAPSTDRGPISAISAPSAASVASSASRSAFGIQLAAVGRSVSRNHTTTASRIDGMPSTRNISRQPVSPNRPSPCWMISVETTAPSAVEIGIAVMNQAVILARCAAGNQ